MITPEIVKEFLALTPEQKMERLLSDMNIMALVLLRGKILKDENDNETDRITITHSTMAFRLESLRTFTRLAFIPESEAEKIIDRLQADEDREAERLDFYGSIGL